MTPAVAERLTIEYNPWAEELYQPSGIYDFNIVAGGRGSSKPYEITQALAIRGHQTSLRIAICREHLNSIKESAKPELDERIRALGLERPDCSPFTTHRLTTPMVRMCSGRGFPSRQRKILRD